MNVHRYMIVALASALIVAAVGCSDTKSEVNRVNAEVAQQEAAAFKQTASFTMLCKGQYVLTVDGKTSEGAQSFGITIDPQKNVAHYFDFEASGSYDRGQRTMNNEILPIGSVDAEWIAVRGYRFNRHTLKYQFQYGVAAGKCELSQTVREIPTRKL